MNSACNPLFHKLYLDIAEYNLEQFSFGIGKLFEAEGRLKDHHNLDGRRGIERPWKPSPARWRILEIDPATVSPDSQLVADLKFDSPAFAELGVLLLEHCGSQNSSPRSQIGST